MTSSRWALRAHAACEWIAWAALMNALWVAGSLAGGAVLGIGPATVAVATLTRRRLRGERVRPVRAFARTWAREFAGSQLTVGVPAAACALIGLQAAGRIASGADAWAATLAVATAFTFIVTTVSGSMHAHYDIPRGRHIATASRWTLRNLGPALLLLATAGATAAATAAVPALFVFLSIGAWLTASTALCLGFFAANDAALTSTNEGVHS